MNAFLFKQPMDVIALPAQPVIKSFYFISCKCFIPTVSVPLLHLDFEFPSIII